MHHDKNSVVLWLKKNETCNFSLITSCAISCKCTGTLATDGSGISGGNAAVACSTLNEFHATSNTIGVGVASNDTMYLL